MWQIGLKSFLRASTHVLDVFHVISYVPNAISLRVLTYPIQYCSSLCSKNIRRKWWKFWSEIWWIFILLLDRNWWNNYSQVTQIFLRKNYTFLTKSFKFCITFCIYNYVFIGIIWENNSPERFQSQTICDMILKLQIFSYQPFCF